VSASKRLELLSLLYASKGSERANSAWGPSSIKTSQSVNPIVGSKSSGNTMLTCHGSSGESGSCSSTSIPNASHRRTISSIASGFRDGGGPCSAGSPLAPVSVNPHPGLSAATRTTCRLPAEPAEAPVLSLEIRSLPPGARFPHHAATLPASHAREAHPICSSPKPSQQGDYRPHLADGCNHTACPLAPQQYTSSTPTQRLRGTTRLRYLPGMRPSRR
jgi:hypothetical protein